MDVVTRGMETIEATEDEVQGRRIIVSVTATQHPSGDGLKKKAKTKKKTKGEEERGLADKL